MPRYAEATAEVMYRDFCWVFDSFLFWRRIAEENWKILFWYHLGILSLIYLAPEFWRL